MKNESTVTLETVKQALSEVLEERGQTVVQVNFTGDLAQLARLLQPEITVEYNRKGNSLSEGAMR